jgi:tryptophan synthase alpha chain
VTGARAELPAGLADRVRWLKTQTDVPILVGFGIASPEQVQAVAAVADGAIVGSALVKLVAERATAPRAALLDDVTSFVRDLVTACG